jgi:hypothetical protein
MARRKYTTISVMTIGHMAMQYSNLTKQPLGGVVDQLVTGLTQGNTDFLELIMSQVTAALTNVTENPVGVAIRGALIAFLFAQGKKIAGHKTIFKVGNFRITV